jgi:hypothetical protein
MQVDGDVLELLGTGTGHRFPLAQLQVRLAVAGKSAYKLAIGVPLAVGEDGEPLPLGPLYGWSERSDMWMVGGYSAEIPRDIEPEYRAFFASLAGLCDGREVVEPPALPEKRGLFGRRSS